MYCHCNLFVEYDQLCLFVQELLLLLITLWQISPSNENGLKFFIHLIYLLGEIKLSYGLWRSPFQGIFRWNMIKWLASPRYSRRMQNDCGRRSSWTVNFYYVGSLEASWLISSEGFGEDYRNWQRECQMIMISLHTHK